MKGKLIVFLFVLILLSSFVAAVPPHQESSSVDGLMIEIPVAQYVEKGVNVKLHTHVFNATGVPVFNDTTSCNLHLYNKTGHHILEQNMSEDSNNLEWTLDINDVFNDTGSHSFLIWCNQSDVGGFARGGFEVTETGVEESISGGGVLIGIILMGITIIFMFLAVAFRESKPWMIFYFLFGFLMMIIDLRFATMVLQSSANIQNMVGNLNSIYGIFIIIFTFLMFMVALYTLFLVIRSFTTKKSKAEMIRESLDTEILFPK